jgi:hypothetical protein
VTTIFNLLASRPMLAALALALVVIILLLPYHLEERLDRRGRRHAVWKSLLWSWKFGPTYERRDCDGLRRLQRIILDLLRDAWAMLRGDVLRRFVDELRRRIGL